MAKTKPTKVQAEILGCLMDNEGDMTFDDLKVDCSSVSSPQGLGRSISAMIMANWVGVYLSSNDEHSVSITRAGEDAFKQAAA